MPHPPVLIAGAGPSGLVLALILLKNGVPVRIIDKERTHRIGSRGAGLHPRTLELYAMLGVLDDILNNAGKIVPTASYDFGELVPKSTMLLLKYHEATPDVPHANTAALNQDRHEEILRAHLAKLSCTVELGAELRSFEQSADSVVARIVKTAEDGTQSEETATFDWLVGTDGAHSVVRKQLGLSFLGETRTETIFALGDIKVEEGLDPNFWHMWNVGPKMILMRPHGVTSTMFNFMLKGRSEHLMNKTLTSDEFAEEFYSLTDRRDVKFGEAAWMSNYRPNIRMVDKMHQGRVFVAGDAAHCHSPAGGQGLNSSVQDSGNLGWKLALVHKGLTPTDLLDTYNEERLRVIAHMLGLTTALLDRNDRGVGEPGKKEFKMHQHGDAMRMLSVNYRGSSIISQAAGAAGAESDPYAEAAGAPVQAAYRAPDAPELVPAGTQGAATRLFEVFSVSAHTVLVFGGDTDARAPVVDALARFPPGIVHAVLLLGQEHAPPSDAPRFGAVFEDRAGHAYRGYGADADALTVVVVRPDGVVGVVASNAEAVEQYFRRILIAV
ncbi:FAD binding domain-containing protein [Mycena rosella]|uniref:FAD binding domain-containing protein n=1 Tax=Mycena rosella TaxID=1033263 RepID=A0AAD7GDL4_MYCRO|nr:FAD binding domain-containing protein [Mycena rosella]